MIRLIKNFYSYSKDLSLRIFNQIREGELQMVAGSLSFSTILCLVPFLAVSVAILQSVAGWETLSTRVENFLLVYLKEAVGPEAIKVIKLSIRNVNAGKLGATGIVFLLLTSVRLLYDLEVAIHRIWNIKIARPLYQRLFVYKILIVLIPLLLAFYVSIHSLEAMKIISNKVPMTMSNRVVLFFVIYLLFKWVPSRSIQSKYAAISALITSLGLYLVHSGFVLVATSLFAYRKIYGGFAALPLLLLWTLSIWYVFLAGVALCAALHRKPFSFSETHRL